MLQACEAPRGCHMPRQRLDSAEKHGAGPPANSMTYVLLRSVSRYRTPRFGTATLRIPYSPRGEDDVVSASPISLFRLLSFFRWPFFSGELLNWVAASSLIDSCPLFRELNLARSSYFQLRLHDRLKIRLAFALYEANAEMLFFSSRVLASTAAFHPL